LYVLEDNTTGASFFPMLAVVLGCACSLLVLFAAVGAVVYRRKRIKQRAVRDALTQHLVKLRTFQLNGSASSPGKANVQLSSIMEDQDDGFLEDEITGGSAIVKVELA